MVYLSKCTQTKRFCDSMGEGRNLEEIGIHTCAQAHTHIMRHFRKNIVRSKYYQQIQTQQTSAVC